MIIKAIQMYLMNVVIHLHLKHISMIIFALIGHIAKQIITDIKNINLNDSHVMALISTLSFIILENMVIKFLQTKPYHIECHKNDNHEHNLLPHGYFSFVQSLQHLNNNKLTLKK